MKPADRNPADLADALRARQPLNPARLHVRLDRDLKRAAHVHAAATDRTLTQLTIDLLRDVTASAEALKSKS